MKDFTFSLLDYQTFVGKDYYAREVITVPANSSYLILGHTGPDLVTYMEDRTVKAVSENQDIDLTVNLYEAPTVTDEGTETITFNNNRDIATAKPSGFQIWEAPTVTDNGLDLQRGNRVKASRGEAAQAQERQPYVMAKDTYYLLEVTNSTPADLEVRIFWNWWENNNIIYR